MPIQLGDLKLYSLNDLSHSLGVTTVTLRNYISCNKLKARKLGGKWYVSEDSIKEYFNSNENEVLNTNKSINSKNKN